MPQQGRFLMTFRDAIEHVVRWSGALPPEAEQNKIRAAVVAALRNVWLDWAWKYFKDDCRISLDAPYSTGTVVYDHTERELTLTDGTWPANAAYGRITLGSSDVIYKIASRKSDTVLTLDPTHNPGADVASTTYQWFRSEYILPDVHRIHQLNDEDHTWSTHYVPADEWHARERSLLVSGSPFFWTLTGARDYYGAMCVRVTGYPTAAQTMDFLATYKPRRLSIDGLASAWTTGTVSSASGTSVAISTNTFADEVLGAIVRLSRNSSQPTDVSGGNPYLDQRVITAVTNAAPNTTLTVDDTLDTDGVSVGTGYCVSDPVDLPEYLVDLFLRWAEDEYARSSVRERRPETAADLRQARILARERDKGYVETPSLANPWSHPAWALLYSPLSSSMPAAYYSTGG